MLSTLLLLNSIN